MNENIGNQRDWIWHGWHIRYTFKRVALENKFSDIPIILLHGFGASLGHWRHNIPVLSQHHTVYALDLLGFGASKKAYTNYGVELWSELVYDFWNTFITQPCIILGNSIGSLIALNTVVEYPLIAKGLVMLSLPDISARQKLIPPKIQPFVNTLENLVASPFLIRLIFYLVRQPSIIRRSLKFAYIDHTNVDDELVNIISLPPHDRGAARALIALSKSVSNFSLSTSELLKQINIPILLLWGKSDRLIPPTSAKELVKINPKIELQLLDNLGHCLHDENPDLFHQLLLKWLAQILDNNNFIDTGC
ncbi:possible alpha/beta hydrolase superfamily [Geminocystis sp. NIES-3708]|uniref:alpha/beta fold hydrolase n=1 Tax=Geminocystis sp. NIES-3708 TaxID=1615909 RepID=UPI0005FCAF2A|nr:alpha/beta fold hydrolase [Geminocystis sp. NIES-3708]BAQ61204.1 possible alpha/beta hydrolase superfamily [Geminocystis sp. NIES-3708]